MDLQVYLEMPFDVRVTHYSPGSKGHGGYHDGRGNLCDPGDPAEPAEVEFELWAGGQRATAVEAILTVKDLEYIHDEILRQIEDKRKEEAA